MAAPLKVIANLMNFIAGGTGLGKCTDFSKAAVARCRLA
jgi:hypothetical protein